MAHSHELDLKEHAAQEAALREHDACHEHGHDHEHGECCGHAHEHSHGHSHGHAHGCEGGHCHGEEEEGGGRVLRIVISALLFIAGLLLPIPWKLLAFAGAYLLVGFEVLREAAENTLHGELFDESLLMALASIGAVCIGEHEEAVAVMLLYQLGEYLQDRAVDSSRDSIRALMDVRPDMARLVENGETRQVNARDVAVGAVIQVLPGESIPLDSTVLEGESTVDTSALTGESLPREMSVGDKALSGCVNLTGTLLLRVDKPYGESSASRILELVEQAEESKAQPEKFITRFARVYTPAVVLAAAVLAVLPPLLGLGSFSEFVRRALGFLVVSCPCALVISIPLTFFSGLGCASHNGILVKGGNYLESLCRVEVAAFDKTGTLTHGRFTVTACRPAGDCTQEELLRLAACAESQSGHPLARSIVAAFPGKPDASGLSQVKERSGWGVQAQLDGKELIVGREAFLQEAGIDCPALSLDATAVCVAYDGRFRGVIYLRDEEKADAREAIERLRALGVRKTAMLTGDRRAAAEETGRALGVDLVRAELLPEDKLREVRALRESMETDGVLIYAGDGINDTPVLAAADVGIAMGALGADAAMEAADVVIMGDEPMKIARAVEIARKTVRVARENIVFSIAIKLLVLLLISLGYVNLWAAVFADVGVCLLAILNALRAMR